MTTEANAGTAGAQGTGAGANAGAQANQNSGAQATQGGQQGTQQQNGAQQGQQNQGTIVNGNGQGAQGDDRTVTAPADFPTDWREKLAKDDAKALERLKRFGSVDALFSSYRAIEQRLSSGELKAVNPFPDKGTDEQKAQWRKDNNVPDSHEGYKIELGDGVVVGEADKPIVAEWTKLMHAGNASNAEVNRALSAYYKLQDAQDQQLRNDDADYKQKSEDALRADWGPDYRRYVNVLENALGALPDGLGELIAGGRLADGRRIGGDARFMKWLLGVELDRNPAATLVPAGGDQGKAMSARLAELKTLVANRSSEYYVGPNRDALQKEYRDLIDAEARAQGRNRAA